MRTQTMQSMVTWALTFADDPFAQLVARAISENTGSVLPSVLRRNLASAGYKIETGARKVLQEVRIFAKTGALIAYGASSHIDDALLQAAVGYLRERAIAAGLTGKPPVTLPHVPAPPKKWWERLLGL